MTARSILGSKIHSLYFSFRCHLPLLYIGVEYCLTNNSKYAEKFFHQSLEIAPEDPYVLHELGVTCFQNNR